ncbi:MAG TPA: pseudouridine synthase [Candidatus Acidoferrales bacterium]|nr:pseudouridine synthase [Candidatus Acidoferrales bacterium]
MSRDRIAVNGNAITAAKFIYVVMNKPRGIVTTAADEKRRETVYSLLPANMTWLAPVGRLDKASEGLLLLTNDSEWGARIAAPETHLGKKYHVQVKGEVSESICKLLQQGVGAENGEVLRAQSAQILRSGEKNTWLQIVLTEGKNRQIRRMLESLGIETLCLIRISIGPLELGTLPKGSWRELTRDEKKSLDRGMNEVKTRAAGQLIR